MLNIEQDMWLNGFAAGGNKIGQKLAVKVRSMFRKSLHKTEMQKLAMSGGLCSHLTTFKAI